MEWKYNDGGRKLAGYKGTVGDCGIRALSICLQLPYDEVVKTCEMFFKKERITKRKRTRSSVKNGIYTTTFHKITQHYGLKWTPLMGIGTGCKVHLNADELPKGRLICNVSKHYSAVVDGVLNDTYDSSRNGNRCVYGYWS
jgi:hypothetical protein